MRVCHGLMKLQCGLKDLTESLGRDLFFVKIVEILGGFRDLMYICNSLDSV